MNSVKSSHAVYLSNLLLTDHSAHTLASRQRGLQDSCSMCSEISRSQVVHEGYELLDYFSEMCSGISIAKHITM